MWQLVAPRKWDIYLNIGLAVSFIDLIVMQETDQHLKALKSIKKDYPKARYICACRASRARLTDGIEVLPWQKLFSELELELGN